MHKVPLSELEQYYGQTVENLKIAYPSMIIMIMTQDTRLFENKRNRLCIVLDDEQKIKWIRQQ